MNVNSHILRSKTLHGSLALVASLGLVLGACAPAATPEPPTATPAPPTDTPVPPTDTPIPTATDTPLPTETPTPEPTPTDTPAPTLTPYAGEQRLVFVSNRGDDPNSTGLYLLHLDGNEITPLDTDFEIVLFPRLSPDGNSIVFTVPDPWSIYTIRADGTHLTQVTDFSSANADWSPDGVRIVFQSDHQNEPQDTPDIYVIDADGENLVEILDDPDIIDYAPKWSPDGGQILFVSRRSGKDELHVMNADGSGLVQVSDSANPVVEGVWSPDGARIAFVYGGFGQTDLYVVDADGVSNVVRLTSDGKRNQNPSWSPDGERIVFTSNRSGNWDLWMINADGSNPVQLTDDEFYDAYPDW